MYTHRFGCTMKLRICKQYKNTNTKPVLSRSVEFTDRIQLEAKTPGSLLSWDTPALPEVATELHDGILKLLLGHSDFVSLLSFPLFYGFGKQKKYQSIRKMIETKSFFGN